jgi:uncharacterized protein
MSIAVLRGFISGIAVAVLMTAGTAGALRAVPQAPPLERPILDQTDTLTGTQVDSLAATINQTRSQKDYQIGILIIPSLEGQDIESYSLSVARTWGIGEKQKNNGLLLLIVKNDRQMRIEVGSGLEGDLTDAESGRIITNVIAPRFKEGNYFEGIRQGIESMQAQVEGRTDPNSARVQQSSEPFSFLFASAVAGIVGLSWVGSVLARTKSWWLGGLLGAGGGLLVAWGIGWTIISVVILVAFVLVGLGLDWLVSRNYRYRASRGLKPSWWAGGGVMGGGGSGGGSFGGGGFSGGGASGGW